MLSKDKINETLGPIILPLKIYLVLILLCLVIIIYYLRQFKG
jgi:hypothetical protein